MPDDPEFSDFMRDFIEAQEAKKAAQREPIAPEKYDFDPAKFPNIPTSNELGHLIDSRAKPVPEPAPKPAGLSANDIAAFNAADGREREERIEFLQDRLGQEQETFEQDFDKAGGLEP